MTDSLTHPMIDLDPHDVEIRIFTGAYGQREEIELESFYWVHLDWYEAHGFMGDNETLSSLVIIVDEGRGTETIADGLRLMVDHHFIPAAIEAAVPPFDGVSEAERQRFIASLKDS